MTIETMCVILFAVLVFVPLTIMVVAHIKIKNIQSKCKHRNAHRYSNLWVCLDCNKTGYGGL